jgi:hypothetical protein
MRSGTLPEMKSSSDGPSANVSVKVDPFNADGPEVVGVASERACLETEMRTTREYLRRADIASWKNVGGTTLGHGMKDRKLGSIGPLFHSPPAMSTLSRREEETLLKTTKAHALKECDPLVKGAVAILMCITPDLYLSCSICRLCSWTYCFSGLGLQGKVPRSSGMYVPVVSPFFSPVLIPILRRPMNFKYATRKHAISAGGIPATAQ